MTTPAKPTATKPSIATLVGSLVLGVLSVLNQTTFKFGSEWYGVITAALAAGSALGIQPIVGLAFRNALHLSFAVTGAITTVVTFLAVVVTKVDLSRGVKGIIEGVLTVLSGLGFGASVQAIAGARARYAHGLTAARPPA